MNPNENNPLSPSGMGNGMSGGGTPSPSTQPSSIPSPVDFTNPDTYGATSSLSMSDTLDSAKDDLTSAGQAAINPMAATPGLSQLGADSPSASMEAPTQPLTPAAPVPGSLGSVTSGSPATDTPTTSANPFGISTPTTPDNGANKPFYNPFASASNTSASTPTASNSTMNTTPATPGAATNLPNMSATSSTSVPPALQPQTEKFSDRFKSVGGGSKKKGNMMMLLGWLMAALFATAAIIFAILWMQKPKVEYIDRPVTNPDPAEDQISLLSCTPPADGGPVEGIENMLASNRSYTATFVDNKLDTLELLDVYTYTDNAAAEASRAYFDGMTSYYNDLANNLGVIAPKTEFTVNEAISNFRAEVEPEQLVGDFPVIYGLTLKSDGTVPNTAEEVKANYEAAGYVCNVE